MSWTIVHTARVPPSPWRNGGGVTRELVAWPRAEDWTWRISVAEVTAGGPFSRFERVQRWFAVLEGDGVRLELGGRRHDVTPASAPFRFDGAEAVDCTLLGGPTRDLNLMVRSDRASASMARVEGAKVLVADTVRVIAIYAVGAPATLAAGRASLEVAAGSLAWRKVAAREPVRIAARQAWCMEIEE